MIGDLAVDQMTVQRIKEGGWMLMELVDMGGSSRVEHVPVAKNVHFFVLKSYDLNMNMSV